MDSAQFSIVHWDLLLTERTHSRMGDAGARFGLGFFKHPDVNLLLMRTLLVEQSRM